MKHFGDITKIKGSDVPSVDIITGGSPCQDLSVGGKGAGLSGERSGLFYEQVRIIKEMRDESRRKLRESNDTRGSIKPRYVVWENVEGAFSSTNGRDFAIVLEELAKVVVEDIPSLPVPSDGWNQSGCIEGVAESGSPFSIAWRLHDAQFWGKTIRDSDSGDVIKLGTPQRRRRVSLVADFGGNTAPKILFESGYMPGDSEESEQEREADASHIGASSDCTISFQERSGKEGGGKGLLIQCDRVGTLQAEFQKQAILSKTYHKTTHPHTDDVAQNYEETNISDTLNGFDCFENRTPMLILENQKEDKPKYWSIEANSHASRYLMCDTDTNQTLCGCMDHDPAHGGLILEQREEFNVRRLTPLEAERLQGFPDNWTNLGDWEDSKGKVHKYSDRPRFKALGNSLCLPFWDWMAMRIVAQLKKDGVDNPTMASLFDGIGGFPLVYQRHGCRPVWASEVEEFCIAVTKKHFGED